LIAGEHGFAERLSSAAITSAERMEESIIMPSFARRP